MNDCSLRMQRAAAITFLLLPIAVSDPAGAELEPPREDRFFDGAVDRSSFLPPARGK
jgi:hypothetical protein